MYVCSHYIMFLCKISHILMGIKTGNSEYNFCTLDLSILDLASGGRKTQAQVPGGSEGQVSERKPVQQDV